MAKRRIAYVAIYLEVPFYGYSSKAKNEKAERQIRRQVKEIARDELSFFSLDDLHEDDCTDKSKIRVMQARLA